MNSNKVYLAGSGPGDLGLVTLKTRSLVETCDVLVYDNLVNPAIKRWSNENCELIDVGKRPGRHSATQVEIGDILVKKYKEGKSVVRLKGGDPFVFGRGGEEVRVLESHNIPFEIIPGVTSALAAAAMKGIPLSHRETSSAITFVTGHEDPEKNTFRVNFEEIAKMKGTICIYMGISQSKKISNDLLKGGIDPNTPVAIVQWATLPKQKSLVSTVADFPNALESKGISSPAIIIIGDTVNHAASLTPEVHSPLAGKKIAITRARSQAGKLCKLLEEKGADVLELPLIKISSSLEKQQVVDIFAEIATYEWIVFTSHNGVRFFMDLFFKAFKDIRSWGPMRIATVGESTAKVFEPYHLEVELIASKSDAETLAEDLIQTDSLDSANVLVVTGNRNNPALVEVLSDKGRAIVDTLEVYKSESNDVSELAEAKEFQTTGADAIVFTSSSGVVSYVEQNAHLKPIEGATQPFHCSIGPVTSKKLQENNISVDIEAQQADLETIVKELETKFS